MTEATIDETEVTEVTEVTENELEIEIAVTEETEGTVENEENEENEETVETVGSAEGPDRHITAPRAVKVRSTHIPLAATTERENEKTGTEGMVEETSGNGTVTEPTEAYLGEMSGEI